MEATSVDLSEATIKKMKVKDLKGELKSRRLLQIGRKAELQDRLIHAIKDKVPIAGVVENTKNKYGRTMDGRHKDARPKKNTSQMSEKKTKDITLATIATASDNSGGANQSII